MKTYPIFVLTLGLLSLPDIGSSSLDPDFEIKVDEFIQQILTCRQIIGINLAVVRSNQVLVTKGYGIVDMETSAEVDESTLFSVASVSKAFTTTLLAKVLAEDGRYTWDTPVREILGDDFYFSDGLRSLHATLRDLASHKMGIPSNNYIRLQQPTREELAQKLRFLEPVEEFRTSFIYSNLMYGLLTYVTEIIGGKSWETLMKEKIFQPLGMTSSGFTHEIDLEAPGVAKPYLLVDELAYRPVSLFLQSEWGKLGGSGSVMTNAEDMSKWLVFHATRGKNQAGQQVLQTNVLEETYQPVTIASETSIPELFRHPTVPIMYDDTKYALAWRVGSYNGYRMVLHTGTSFGYGALLTLIPDLDLAIATTITGPDSDYIGRRLIHMYILDLLMGESPWLNLTTACTFPEPWSQQPAKGDRKFPEKGSTRLDLTKYEGTYGNFAYGNLTVAQNGSQLQMSIGDFALWNLHPKEENSDDFTGEGVGHMWSSKLYLVRFFSDSMQPEDHVDHVLTSFDSKMPPIFTRNLKMADAPPPPDLNDCSNDHKSTAISQKGLILLDILTFIFVFCYTY